MNIQWKDFEQWHDARMCAYDELKAARTRRDKKGVSQYTTMLAEVDAKGQEQFPNHFSSVQLNAVAQGTVAVIYSMQCDACDSYDRVQLWQGNPNGWLCAKCRCAE